MTLTLTQLLSLVLTVGAVVRVTRLLARDVILERPRAAVVKRLMARGRESLAYLVVCPWCLSMYLGAAFAGAWYAWGTHPLYICLGLMLTASYIAGYLGTKESE